MGKLKSVILYGGYLALAAALFVNGSILSADSAYNYDVNGDGAVNVMDMLNLKSHLLGADKKQNSVETTKDKDYFSIYKPVLKSLDSMITGYNDIQESGGVGGELGGAAAVLEIRSMMSKDAAGDFTGYTITDINGDGIKELIVGEIRGFRDGKGYGERICAIYTCSDDKPVCMIEGSYRSQFYYAGSNNFIYEGSSGASLNAKGVFTLEKNSTEVKWTDFYFTKSEAIDSEAFETVIYHNTTGIWDTAYSEKTGVGEDVFYNIEFGEDISEIQFDLFSSLSETDVVPVGSDIVYHISHKFNNVTKFTASESESAVSLFFYAKEKVTDFKFLNLTSKTSDDGKIIYDSDITYSQDEVTENCPVMVKLLFAGSIPNNGISYVDSNGVTRRFTVSLSGRDGSVELTEF